MLLVEAADGVVLGLAVDCLWRTRRDEPRKLRLPREGTYWAVQGVGSMQGGHGESGGKDCGKRETGKYGPELRRHF